MIAVDQQVFGWCLIYGMGWDGMGWGGMGWDALLTLFAFVHSQLVVVFASRSSCPSGGW